MQSQDSRYHENFLRFSKSRKVILYVIIYLQSKELQIHQMQKWLTQAALRTTTDDIIDFSEYSSLFVEKKEYASLLENRVIGQISQN